MEHAPDRSAGGGRYSVLRSLGEGTTKRAFVARDSLLEREVVLSFLKTDGLPAERIERLRREAIAIGRLGVHPNVVTLYDVLLEGERVVLVSEYLAGGDLSGLVASSAPLPLPHLVEIARDVAGGLGHAHGCGLLHRDLSPGNVWLTREGVAKVGDFGLAVSLSRERSVRAGTMLTAATYMAPELALGGEVDARADLYSFGVLLYELLCGRPPFVGDDAVAILSQHIYTAPVAPSWHRAEMPPVLEELVLQLLRKDPGERPQSAAVVLSLLPDPGDPLTVRVQGAATNPLDRLAAGIFVGRREFLASLREAAEAAFAGRTRVVLVAGEPGIGKTRLGEEIATYARLRNARVLVGRCSEEAGAPAYWPWIQILRARERAGGDAVPPAERGDLSAEVAALLSSERLSAAEPRERGAERERFRFFDRVARFFERLTRREPLLVVLDDLHWADRASLELLRFLVRELADARLLLIAMYRDTDVALGSPLARRLFDIEREVVALRLKGLATPEIAQFIEQSIGIEAAPELVTALAHRSGGNPLLLAELVRFLATEGDLTARAVLHRELPPGVRHIVQRRVERLPEVARRHLEIASVLGRDFAIDVLAALAGSRQIELEASLQAARDARILAAPRDEPGRLAFSHSIVRDALYDGIDPEQRSKWHGQAAAALARIHAADLSARRGALAHHLLRTGRIEDLEGAIEHARAAGEHALAHFAYEDAAAQFEAALEALDRLGRARAFCADDGEVLLRRAEIVERLAEARWSAGQHGRAREAYLELAALARRARSPVLLARAAMGNAGKADPDFHGAPDRIRLLEEALESLPAEDSSVRARLLSSHATRLYLTPERERGIAMAREAVAVSERIGDRDALLGALSALHYTLLGPTPVSERRELAERVKNLAWERGSTWYRLWGHFWCVLDALEAGDVVEADAEMGAFSRLAEEFRDPFFLWQAASLRAMRAAFSGRLDEAEHLANEAFALAQQAESPNAMLGYATQLTAIRRAQGRAGELVEHVSGIAAEIPDQPGVQIAIAVLCAESGRAEEARLALERTFAHDLDDHARDVHWTGLLYYCALALDRMPDRARAQRVYDLLLPLDGRCVVYSLAVAAEGAVAHGLGLLARVLGRDEDAARHFADAIDMSERMSARPALARACYDAAALALARGGPGDAEGRALLRRAVETFEALGMPAHLERARALESAIAAPGAGMARPAEHGPNRFRRTGDFWDLRFRGETARVRDLKGLLYLQALLREPAREFHVLDLVGAVERAPRASASRPRAAAEGLAVERNGVDAPDLDALGRTQYRTRLRDLTEEIAAAEDLNDLGRLERLRAEKDFIEHELARAFGLGGRPVRRHATGERARKAVYNCVKKAVEHIGEVHPRLGRHLAGSISTGSTCVYRPEQPIDWETG